MGREIYDIINDMAEVLNASQIQKLQEVLVKRLSENNALFVSLNKPYSRLNESGVELRLREKGKKLGVEKVHPHKFRRTMATRAIEKGMPIEQV